MKKLLILVCICCFAATAFAQDYIITEAAYQQGKVQRHGKDQLALRKQGLEGYQMINLSEVKEFKIGNTVYEARVVNGNRDFFSRLLKGRYNLYKGSSNYIIEDSTKRIVFDKGNFRSILSTTLQCTGYDPDLSKLHYNKRSILRVVRMYNKEGCNTDLLPRKKIGIIGGYNVVFSDVRPSALWSASDKSTAPSGGVFIDLPLPTRKPSLYFTVEVNYFAFNSNYNRSTSTSDDYMGLEISGTNVLGSFKFIKPRGVVRPYLKLGASSSFLNINCPTGIVSATKDGNVVRLDGSSPGEIGSVTLLGFNVAGGVEIPLAKRINLHLEMRYMKSTRNSVHALNIGLSNLGLTAGITF